jgi:hypothetical protein
MSLSLGVCAAEKAESMACIHDLHPFPPLPSPPHPQVARDHLACEFGDASDPESGIRSIRVCVASLSP